MNFINFVLLIAIKLILITCPYRKETIHFFDPYHFAEIYENFYTQSYKKKCSLDQGPDCFFTSSFEENIGPNFEFNSSYYPQKNLENVYSQLQDEISARAQTTKGPKVEIDQEAQLRLLLTFESYEQLTRNDDYYMPEELNTEYDKGHILLKFKGKLRLTQKGQITPKEQVDENNEEIPSGPYGIIEGKEVEVSFEKPSVVKSLFIKKNTNSKVDEFKIVGIKGEKEIILGSTKEATFNKWTKLNLPETKVDKFILPHGFDVDNIKIIYTYESSEIENTIKELVDKLLQKEIGSKFKVIKMEYDPNTGKFTNLGEDDLDITKILNAVNEGDLDDDGNEEESNTEDE